MDPVEKSEHPWSSFPRLDLYTFEDVLSVVPRDVLSVALRTSNQ